MSLASTRHQIPDSEIVHHPGDWLSPARFTLLLGGFIFVCFPDVVLAISTFIFRDFGMFAYPLAYYHRERFWQGEVPLWNPLADCGLPFLAQWNTMVLYPGSLFYLLLPLTWSLAVFCLLHQFIGGMGAYLLAERWTGNRLAAAVAGTAFAFNGLTLNSLMWTNNSVALGWMPWVVLTASAAWREGGRKIAIAAPVGALQMLSGGPEIISTTWVVTTLLLLVECPGNLPGFRRQLTRFIFLVVLVASLSAAQLLPFLELMFRSHRDQSFLDASWPMPGWGWANLLVPQFYTFILYLGVKFQYGQGWTSSYYLGIGTLALALFAAWRVRKRQVWALAIVTCVGLILALGDQTPLYGWLRHAFPPLAWVRFPVKFVIPSILAVPLLAAFAISSLRADDATRTNSNRVRLALLWAVLVFLIVGLVWFAYANPQYGPPYNDWSGTLRSGISRVLFLSAIIGVFVQLNRVVQPVPSWLLQMGLVILVWLDVWTHVPDQNPRVSPAAYRPGISQLSPKPLPGVSRAMISPMAKDVLFNQGVTNAFTNYICNRLALNANLNLLEGIPKPDGFFSLQLREYSAVNDLLYATRHTEIPALMDFLSISHVTQPSSFFDWNTRTSQLPMITSGQQPILADAPTTLAALTNSSFDPRHVVYFPADLEPRIRTRNPVRAQISVRHSRGERLELLVSTPGPTILVIAQAYYPSWQARIDGRPEPVLRANHAFQAVEVPAGIHNVVLHYEDQAFRCGMVVSILAMVFCSTAWLRPGNFNREPNRSTGEKRAPTHP